MRPSVVLEHNRNAVRELVGHFHATNPRIFGLESMLGIYVDLLTPSDLPSKFRAQVLAKVRPI
jgi:uncharacterized protein